VLGSYLAFVHAIPALTQWSLDHPGLAKAVFNDFPPWPWVTVAILGLVMGWTWLDARARGQAHEDRYFIAIAAAGVLLLLWYVGWEWWKPTPTVFGFDRDHGLNRHWSPRGVTICLVFGGIAVLLAATYWLMERRRLRAPWLVLLGQTAMMLYFVHQIIELTLVKELLGIRMTGWPVYWIANALFVALLVFLGRAWLGIKNMWGTRRSPQATG